MVAAVRSAVAVAPRDGHGGGESLPADERLGGVDGREESEEPNGVGGVSAALLLAADAGGAAECAVLVQDPLAGFRTCPQAAALSGLATR